MPYINSDGRRKALRNGDTALTAGELNYQIFYYVKHILMPPDVFHEAVIKSFIIQFLGEHPNYQKYNDMIGVLIMCGKEIKRRLKENADFLPRMVDDYDDEIAKYEDEKIVSNGDVE